MAREENIADVLARRLKEHGLLRNFLASRVCEAAKRVSKGEFDPISFKNGVLKIEASSSGKAHLLKLRETELVKQVNHELEKDEVRRLMILVKR